MQVEYDRHRRGNHGGPYTESESIRWWLNTNLNQGGTELQLAKLRRLVAIIAEQWLIDNPKRVGEVAEVIECEGYQHRITPDDE